MAERERVRRRSPQERRDEILHAAVAELAERPVERITLGTVADRAGVSRALVTHYFRTRDALIAGALQAVTAAAPDVLETDESLSAAEIADRNMGRWLDMVEANPRAALMLAGSGRPGISQPIAEALDAARDRVVDRIVANRLGGVEPAPHVRAALRAWTGLHDVVVSDWLEHGRLDRRQVHVLLTDALTAILEHVVPRLPPPG